jgi:hypothetical protein
VTPAIDAGEPGFIALHALRIKGAATFEDVARIGDLKSAELVLAPFETAGLLTRLTAGDMVYLALTNDGRQAVADAMLERVGSQARAELGRAYDTRFLPVNLRLKRLCADWQSDQRFEHVETAVEVHQEVSIFLGEAAWIDERFAVYERRLEAAMDRFQSGEHEALAAPVGESYHNVWFELHEDLILTLGRSRADEQQ